VEKRRAIFCKMEDIQQERGSVAIPFFLASFATGSQKVQNLKAHPSMYNLLDDVWLKEA
jgi:peptide/nickel transport system substrate-binding protein